MWHMLSTWSVELQHTWYCWLCSFDLTWTQLASCNHLRSNEQTFLSLNSTTKLLHHSVISILGQWYHEYGKYLPIVKEVNKRSSHGQVYAYGRSMIFTEMVHTFLKGSFIYLFLIERWLKCADLSTFRKDWWVFFSSFHQLYPTSVLRIFPLIPDQVLFSDASYWMILMAKCSNGEQRAK